MRKYQHLQFHVWLLEGSISYQLKGGGVSHQLMFHVSVEELPTVLFAI